MRVSGFLLASIFALNGFATTIDRITITATGGKSMTGWHGQADLGALSVELGHDLSPRTEVGVVIAPVNLWQPRSWFGDQYGDGNESVNGLSGALLARRKFNVRSDRSHFYLEGAFGPVWAEKRVPAATSHFNFISQAGAGLIIAPRSRLPFVIGYRFLHISNGGYAPRNPGLNISALVLGVRVTQ